LTDENLVLDSVIKSAYQGILDAKTGMFKDIMDYLDPNYMPGPVYLTSMLDTIIVYQYIGRDIWGEYDNYFYSEIQPCTGERRVWQNPVTLQW